MSPTMVWEPADGVAISRCISARWHDPAHRATTDHPGECGWCDYPPEELARLLDGFNRWAKWNERAKAYDSHECRVFRELPAAEQRRLIEASQQLTGEPWPPPKPEEEPVRPVEPTPPDAIPPRPSWLG